MAESRQQRRARERAEAKAARRSLPPGTPSSAPAPPAATAPAPRRQRVLEVELTRFCDDPDDVEDGEDPSAWHAEWALQDDSVATEESGIDVSELINCVVQDAAAQWGSRYDLTIEWKLNAADPLPEGQTIEGILNDLGVTLPRRVPAPQ